MYLLSAARDDKRVLWYKEWTRVYWDQKFYKQHKQLNVNEAEGPGVLYDAVRRSVSGCRRFEEPL